jgi:hypothetical protein
VSSRGRNARGFFYLTLAAGGSRRIREPLKRGERSDTDKVRPNRCDNQRKQDADLNIFVCSTSTSEEGQKFVSNSDEHVPRGMRGFAVIVRDDILYVHVLGSI